MRGVRKGNYPLEFERCIWLYQICLVNTCAGHGHYGIPLAICYNNLSSLQLISLVHLDVLESVPFIVYLALFLLLSGLYKKHAELVL